MGSGEPFEPKFSDNLGVDAHYLTAIVNFRSEPHFFPILVIDQPIKADGFWRFVQEPSRDKGVCLVFLCRGTSRIKGNNFYCTRDLFCTKIRGIGDGFGTYTSLNRKSSIPSSSPRSINVLLSWGSSWVSTTCQMCRSGCFPFMAFFLWVIGQSLMRWSFFPHL